MSILLKINIFNFIYARKFICFHSFIYLFIKNYSQRMQEDFVPLKKLPRRQYNVEMKFSKGQYKKLLSNYYDIKLPNKDQTIYQFVLDITPEIPQDSKSLLIEVTKSIRKWLRQQVGYVTASGLIVWGTKDLKMPIQQKTEFKYEGFEHKFQVLVKRTKFLDISELMKTPDGMKLVLQIFNNKIKGVLRQKGYTELSYGKYFNPKEVRCEKIGLNILRGFKFTLCPLKNNNLTLQIDVCSRVFRSRNLLQEMNNMSKDAIAALAGSLVITRYGRIRTYKIEKVYFDMSPMDSFYHDKTSGKITFAKYYQQSYALKIKSKNQPLIEVILRTEKKMNKQGQLQRIDIKGFLIPQFVALTGMSDEQKSNYETMREIAPYTKLSPDQRVNATNIMNNQFRNSSIEILEPRRVVGIQLDEPSVKLSNNNTFKAKDGNLNFKDKVKQAVQFKDWVIVYSQGKNPNYDDKDADSLSYLLTQAAKAFDIKFFQPAFITCDSNINSWKKEIASDIKKNGTPQIIVLFFNPNEEKFYGQLKQFLTCQYKIPSQGIRKRTVGPKSKNPMSAASKIIIQMNQKAGGITWQVKRDSYFEKRKCMYGAFSISKGKKGFTLAFVGTLNPENTKIYNNCKTGYARKEGIPKNDFNQIYKEWAKNFVAQNKCAPQLILIYREGLSIPQIHIQLKDQIQALRQTIELIGQKTQKANYKPQLMYLTVNKKINTRFFDIAENGNSGKFLPKVNNPSSGTAVFDQFSVDNLYDFHLAAQKVTQGTCTPTQYIVVLNESTIPQENLAQFTYEQCFNYYNWQGAVKVPACMQCSDKLAKLVGQSIQSNVTEGSILKSYFFL